MKLVVAFGLAAALGAPTGPGQDELRARDQQELVEEFCELDEWSPAGQARMAEILDTLAVVPELDDGDVRKWEKRIEKHWKRAPELEKQSGRHFLYPDAEPAQARGKYIVGGETKRPKGLVIAMHGGGVGSGDAEPMAQGYDSEAKERKLLMIAPEVLAKTERGWTDAGTEEFVLQLIQRALVTWDIDPERVYLSGHSMGGYGSWAIGAHHADWCAGLAPSAGGPTPVMDMTGKMFDVVEGMIPNMRNVRLVVYQSDDDVQVPPEPNQLAAKKIAEARERWGGYDFEYWEVTGQGHAAPPGGYGALLDKIVDHERVVWPDTVVWQPTLAWDHDFYWLHWDEPLRNAIVHAVAEDNVITIETSLVGGKGLGVWLDERLVDLDEPVKVVLNGEEVFEGEVAARLDVLVESAARRDAQYLTAYRIDLD